MDRDLFGDRFVPDEDAFEDKLIQQATVYGWRAHAERRSRSASGRHATAIKGHRGWPDLSLAHAEKGMVIVELKGPRGSFGDGQVEWLERLGRWQTSRFLVAVWRPVDWDFVRVCLEFGVPTYREMLERLGPLPSTVGRRKLPDLRWPRPAS